MIEKTIYNDLKFILLIIAAVIVAALAVCSEPSPEEQAQVDCVDALQDQLSGRQIGNLIHGASGERKDVSYSLKLWYCRKIGPRNVQEKIDWAKKNVKQGWFE